MVTELRAGDDEDGRMILGYAAIFGVRTDLGYITEEIAPGAFDDVLGDDVRCLFNHDPDHILGRTSAKTLRIKADEKGLRYEADMPESPIGDTVLGAIKRADISGNSFSFTVAEDTWDYTADTPHRVINKLGTLYDVGPVTFPAYEGTELSARAMEAARQQVAPPARNFAHERRRLEMQEIE